MHCHVLGGLSISLLLLLMLLLAPLDAAADVVEVVVIDMVSVVMVEEDASNTDFMFDEDMTSCCGVGFDLHKCWCQDKMGILEVSMIFSSVFFVRGIKTQMTHNSIQFCSKREPKRFRTTINE